MNKHGITRKTVNRILAAAVSLALLLTTVPSFTMSANAKEGGANEDKRFADDSTADIGAGFLDIAGSTYDSGRIWTDKSVYNIYDSATNYGSILGVNVTGMPDAASGADFLEVFSALGTSTAVNGAIPVMDVMFVLDMSGSMGESTLTKAQQAGLSVDKLVASTRLAYAVEALNNAFDYVQGQNELNRVGLTVYSGEGLYDTAFWNEKLGQDKTDASNGMTVLGLGQYTTDQKDNDGKNAYFTVSGNGNPVTSDVTGIMGHVYMSVNVNENTLIDGEEIHDSRVRWKDTGGSVYYTKGQLLFYDSEENEYFVFGEDKYTPITVPVTEGQTVYNSKGESVPFYEEEIIDMATYDFDLKEKLRAAGATNTQMGLYTAMSEMVKEENTSITVDGEAVTRLPVVILLTDGIPTISETADKWWEWGPNDDRDGVQGEGNEPYAYGNYMLAMATASYMKREINKNYFGVSNPAGEKSALVYTFGIELPEGSQEGEIADAFLNPKEYFESEFDESVTYHGNNAWEPELIKKAWAEYQEKGCVNVLIKELAGAAARPGDEITCNITWSNDEKVGGVSQPATVKLTLTLDGRLSEEDIVKIDGGVYDEQTEITWTLEDSAVTWTIKAAPADKGAVSLIVRVPDNAALLGETFSNHLDVYVDDDHRWQEDRKTTVVSYDEYGMVPEEDKKGSFDYGEYWYELKSPEKQGIDNIDDIDTLAYNDEYWSVSSNELENALQEALESFHKIPVPIEGKNDIENAGDDMLSYYDPIGDYMELKVSEDNLLGKLYLFGQSYNVKYEDGRCYIDGDLNREITNPSYGNDVKFKLGDINITVESSTVNGLKRQVLRVDIPAAALPVRTATVNLGFDPVDVENAVAKTVVRDYTASDSYTGIAPLRLFYAVGMQDDYLREDGSIDLSLISAEYREQHLDPATGRVSFYSNLYSSKDGDTPETDRGDAYTTFSPADANRYYIYQSYLPLLDEDGNKVTSYVDTAEYYYNYTYYTSDEVISELTPARLGSGVSGEGDLLVWYNLNDGKVADFAKKPTTGGNWVVAVKPGGISVGDMSHLTDQKAHNTTVTSGTSCLPTVSDKSKKDNVIVTSYLGNNGVRSAKDVTLLLTKQVDNPDDGEGQSFSFTVTIPSLANRNDITAVKYVLNNDNGKWIPLYNDNGEQDTETVTFDSNGTASVTLKHGEGLLFCGLKDGEEVTVTETLTEAQLKENYRLAKVQDESGSLMAMQSNTGKDAYTVKKTLASTDSNNAPVLNEIHWFNKTAKFDKEETHINGKALGDGDIRLDKDGAHGPTLHVGDKITYRISWVNDAVDSEGKPVKAKVIITDELDKGVEYVPTDNGGVYDPDTHTVTWTIEEAVEGESGFVTLTVRVTEDALDDDYRVENDAVISVENGSRFETKLIENPVEVEDPYADLNIEKSQAKGKYRDDYKDVVSQNKRDNPLQVDAYDYVTYYLTVTVTGKTGSTLDNVIVRDKIPDGLIYVEGSVGGEADGKYRGDGVVEWKLGTRKVGETVTVWYTVQVPPRDETTQWVNIAHVIYGVEDPEDPPSDPTPDDPGDPGDDDDDNDDPDKPHKPRWKPSEEVVIEENPEPGIPNLTIVKKQSVKDCEPTDELLTVEAGDTVTYYLIVTNESEAIAKDVIVSDVIPDGLTLVKTGGKYEISDGGKLMTDEKTIVWELGELAAGESKTVTFKVTVPAVDSYKTWTNIAAVSADNDPENALDDPDAPIDPNDPHKGRKPKDSNKVVIEEEPEQDTPDEPDDPDEPDEPDEPGIPKLEIEKAQSVNGGDKTKDKLKVEAGDSVTYYITIRNTGTAAAEGVVVTDEVPDGLKLNTIGNNGTRLNDGKTIVWNIGELKAQGVVTVSFTVTVPEVDKETVWKNIATVSYENDPENPPVDPDGPAEPDPNDPHKGRKPKDSNEVEIEEEIPKLKIEKAQSVNGGEQTKDRLTVVSGDAVTYYLTVTNIGKATAKDVIIADEIPDGLLLSTIGNNGTRLFDGKTIVWNIGELKAGGVVTVSFTVTVPKVDRYTEWKNIAAVSFGNDPENPPVDPDEPDELDPNDPHKGRKPKPSNEVEIEEEPVPEPEPPAETAPPTTTEDDRLNLDDDGLPRGDMDIPTDDDRLNLDDDGLPRGDMNIPTGVVVGGGLGISSGALLLAALVRSAGKRRQGRKDK